MALCAFAFFAFNTFQSGSIKGTVTPVEGGFRAWAISSTDTLKADIDNGQYEIKNLRPGTYRVIIEAKKSYKNAAKEGVVLTEAASIDIGNIQLVKDSMTIIKN